MISVCIATYNGEKYIREQLMSILPQLSAEDEVIVSDDASTDNTLQIIDDLHDSRIQIYQHTSYINARSPMDKTTHNFENALRQAKGDYIFLADQDDVWLPNKIQIVMDALQNADLAVHDCVVVDTALQPLVNSYFDYIHVHKGALQNAIRCTYLGCCMAFRRPVLNAALPIPKHGVAHDLWIGITAGLHYNTILVQSPLILYRRHKHTETNCGGKSHLSFKLRIKYKLLVLFHMFKKALKQ